MTDERDPEAVWCEGCGVDCRDDYLPTLDDCYLCPACAKGTPEATPAEAAPYLTEDELAVYRVEYAARRAPGPGAPEGEVGE